MEGDMNGSGANTHAPSRLSGPIPLSYAQQRLWLLSQSTRPEPWSAAVHLKLQGALRRQTLRRALDRIVARHEALRTTFHSVNGEPMQVIGAPEIGLELIERAIEEREAARAAEHEACHPFDLARGPLIRGLLLSISQNDHLLILTLHRIIGDSASLGTLVRELCALYEAFADGRGDPLPPVQVQYSAYALRQRQQLTEEATQKEVDFWRKNLADAPESERLPTDRPRPAEPFYATQQVQLTLSRTLTERLEALAEREGVTLYTTLLSAWAVLLGRWSGQDEVLIGSPVANDRHPAIDPVIGCFDDAIPQRIRLPATLTVKDLLRHVNTTAADARAHQSVPFDHVLKHLIPEDRLRNRPLVEVAIGLDRAPAATTPPADLKGAELRIVDVTIKNATTQLDLSLCVSEGGQQGLAATLEYADCLFERQTLERLLACWQVLLKSMSAHPDRPLGQLSLLDPTEHNRVVRLFNAQSNSAPQTDPDPLVHELFEAQARRTPNAIALVCEGSSLTYADLNDRANRLAQYLAQKGVSADDLVALCAERSFEMLVGVLGILKAGGAYVPLDPHYPNERLGYILHNAAPRILLTQERLKDRFPQTSSQVIALDSEWHQIHAGHQGTDSHPDARARGMRSHHLAYVIYTSGSTGDPKGVMVEHRNVTRLFSATQQWFRFSDRDVWTLFHSFAFDFSVWEIWGALLYGGRLVVVPYLTARSPREFYQLVCAERVTVLSQTPSAFAQLIDAAADSPDTPHSLRVVVFGGEALELRTLRPWVQRNGALTPQLVNMYGITETTVHVTYCPLDERAIETESASLIGKPIPDLQTYLLDRCGQPVPIGWVGELHIGGAGVARGYLGRPELTAERFLRDPFSPDPHARLYKTGDLGRWRDDGTLEYLGRNDHQVKIRGFRIELGEIEAQLARHELVKEAVVIAREDVPGEKRLVAYVTTDIAQLKARQTQSSRQPSGAIVEQWKSLYDNTYSAQSTHSAGATGPSFVGWNSSYTGESIPESEMREWLQGTIERISALQPHRVLEIGCGVGLLLEQLAPACEVYRGIDLSAEALARLREWLSSRADLQHVQLNQCSALELEESPPNYDTVILNSVAQYFPDAEYLLSVLRRAVRAVSPGGRIFVGDVRHLGLLRAFHSSVQLERAHAGTPVGTLRRRIARAIELEKELLVDPRFFTALPQELPEIGGVQILLKRGHSDNELTRYRYDVILEVRDTTVMASQSPPASLRLGALKNRGLCRDLTLTRLIETTEDTCTVERLRELLANTPVEGEDPETYWTLGEQQGYDPKSATPAPNLHDYANDPLGRSLQQQLIPRLREHLAARVPSYMVPSALVVLERFPLTRNGKLDRRALPSPNHEATSGRPYEPPQGEIEELLARSWQELLRIEHVGRQDNFFELGGHSLLLVQLMEQLRRVGLSAEIRPIYESPTLADLAATLTRKASATAQIPPNRIPSDCQSITPDMLPLVRLEADPIQRIFKTVPGGAANVQDIYPLAPLQEGMLVHHLLNERRGDAYVLLILYSLSSQERLEAFIRGLQAVIDRHDILRTAVLWEDLPRAVQVVYRRVVLPVQGLVLDPHRDCLEQLKELMKPELQTLELRQAPLMRLQTARDPRGAQWYALLQIHHLVHDHASLDTMLAEVMAHVEGRAHQLPQPISYRNHVAQALAHTQPETAEAFFRSKLAEINEPTAPFGILNVHGDGGRVVEVQRALDPTLARRLRAQARALNVSAATLFHAAWALVVSRTSERDDVVFGTVLLGRMQGAAAAPGMLGMFINTLPLRLRLRDVTVTALVAQTQREVLELLAHEQAPLAVAQRCSGISGTAALFTTLLNYYHSSNAPLTTSGIEMLAFQEWSNYPIALSIDDRGEQFVLTAQTDRRIDPQRMMGYLSTAMQSLVDALDKAPQTPAAALSVIPEDELRQITGSFSSATHVSYSHEKLVHELFEEQAQRTPEHVAVACAERRLSYAELNGRANQLARYLRERGVGPDRPVGICMERGPDMVVAMLGTLKAGGAYVPLDPTYPPERLRYLLNDSAPAAILTQSSLKSALPTRAAGAIRIDTDWEAIGREPDSNLAATDLQLTSQHLAYIIYTSGSTGTPKGVMVEHRNLVNLLQWQCRSFAVRPGDRCSSVAAVGFDAAVWEVWPPLTAGATVVMAPPTVASNPESLLTWWSREPLEVSFLPTPMAELAFAQGITNPGLRTLLVGGDRLHRVPPSKAFQLINCYGPTESTVVATSGRLHDGDPVLHIGGPISNTQIHILGAGLRPVPIGVTGEIFIGGAGLARGYLGRPDLTAERFIANPLDTRSRLYKSGDLAQWRADGTIEYVGRADQQVKLRGLRIEPGEIEAQLARHPKVSEAIVTAREDIPGHRRLVAYLTCRGPSQPSIESLRAHLTAVLPEYMVPSAFLIMSRLPLTPNGKLDRRALPIPEHAQLLSRPHEPPQGEMEEMVAGLWQELLHLEQVGRDDSFFWLGGHSILAMQVMVRIRARLLIDIPMSVLFEFPTVRQLACQLLELRQARLRAELSGAGTEIETLLEAVTTLPDSKVQEWVRNLERSGTR